ncbi:MAG TPA: hypothetical protein VMV69_22725 [Pirellulales bacterium]|nr:hypothetical protein [Pirellulales bacterium]
MRCHAFFGGIKMSFGWNSVGRQRVGRQCPARVCLAVTGFRLAAAGALVLSLASREAEATCGDYVMIGGEHAPQHHQSPRPNSGQSLAPGESPRVPPCDSPSCQRRRMPPIAPERGNRDAGGSQWADWRIAIFSNRADRSRAWFQDTFLELEGHFLPPLRPPCVRG